MEPKVLEVELGIILLYSFILSPPSTSFLPSQFIHWMDGSVSFSLNVPWFWRNHHHPPSSSVLVCSGGSGNGNGFSLTSPIPPSARSWIDSGHVQLIILLLCLLGIHFNSTFLNRFRSMRCVYLPVFLLLVSCLPSFLASCLPWIDSGQSKACSAWLVDTREESWHHRLYPVWSSTWCCFTQSIHRFIFPAHFYHNQEESKLAHLLPALSLEKMYIYRERESSPKNKGQIQAK